MEQQIPGFEYINTKWRTRFLRTTLIGACIFGLIALVPAITSSLVVYSALYIIAYIVILLATFLPVHDNFKAGTLIALVYFLSVSGITETGVHGSGRLFLLGAIILACLLFSWKAGWWVFAAGMVTYIIFGWLILGGRLTLSNPRVEVGNLELWISNLSTLLLLSVLIINGIRLSQSQYDESERRALSFFKDLADERKTLEQRINERTQKLDKRTSQLQAVADIGKSITSYRNLSELLEQASILIHENFGYYHVGIFLLDERKEYAILTATNSEGGRRMLEKGHQLKVGETGIVGYVSESLIARIALDVGNDAVFFNNPDLPSTRSEMALPLVASGQILGVLDVQSTEPRAFVEDDINTLQILAEQLAVAIQNANLFSETAKALESTRATYGQLSREAWNKILRSQDRIGFLATPPATVQIQNELLESNITKAIETGDLILGADGLTISVPVKIRGQVIGAIRLKKSEISEAWTQDETNLAISLSDQLSGALESARLYRESQQRAYRESLVSDISARINASATRDAIIRETVQELGQSLLNTSVTFQLLDQSYSENQADDTGRAVKVPLNE
jgi:GAF domain-containing protein